MLWNWNHRFREETERRILWGANLVPAKVRDRMSSSSFASSGNGILKKILRRTSWETSTLPLSDPLSPSCTSPVRDLSPNDLLLPLSSFRLNLALVEPFHYGATFAPAAFPDPLRCPSYSLDRCRDIAAFWSGCIAIVGVACGRQMLWPHFVGQLRGSLRP
jgi:hypothetical protein